MKTNAHKYTLAWRTIGGKGGDNKRIWGDRAHARTHAHQGVHATRPLRELVQQHAPRTLADAAECVRRLAAEVPRLKSQAALELTGGTWTPEAAAVLKEVQRVDILLDMVLSVADDADKSCDRSVIIAEAVAQISEVDPLLKRLTAAWNDSNEHIMAGTLNGGGASAAVTSLQIWRDSELLHFENIRVQASPSHHPTPDACLKAWWLHCSTSPPQGTKASLATALRSLKQAESMS